MKQETYYITTTLPYVNAAPHIGFAQEITAADVLARYYRALGKEVVFNTGTDEHGQKIYEQAQAAGIDPQAYCDQYAAHFSNLKTLLNLSYTNFIRTTNPEHIAAAQTFWQRCADNDDIYKRLYKISYCVGCELEKQASELADGRCPLHPNKDLEVREEENYFFRFSKYQEELLNLYENQPNFVLPASKLKEIQSFVAAGLQDFSISRLKDKMPWGVPVPGDNDHVMYVWFDALVNYISTLGWPADAATFTKFWPGTQVAGKDNLRQQSAMWQAMLLSAKLPTAQQIFINGFITVDGQKMSKSTGTVIAPTELVERYGTEAARYLLINLGPFGEDMDVTWEKLDQTYTADLANGLGNLCSRVAKLCEKYEVTYEKPLPEVATHLQFVTDQNEQKTVPTHFHAAFTEANLAAALHLLVADTSEQNVDSAATLSVAALDKHLAQTAPWKQSPEDAVETLRFVVDHIITIATHLQPFMPETAQIIITHFTTKDSGSFQPLFPRL